MTIRNVFDLYINLKANSPNDDKDVDILKKELKARNIEDLVHKLSNLIPSSTSPDELTANEIKELKAWIDDFKCRVEHLKFNEGNYIVRFIRWFFYWNTTTEKIDALKTELDKDKTKLHQLAIEKCGEVFSKTGKELVNAAEKERALYLKTGRIPIKDVLPSQSFENDKLDLLNVWEQEPGAINPLLEQLLEYYTQFSTNIDEFCKKNDLDALEVSMSGLKPKIFIYALTDMSSSAGPSLDLVTLGIIYRATSPNLFEIDNQKVVTMLKDLGHAIKEIQTNRF